MKERHLCRRWLPIGLVLIPLAAVMSGFGHPVHVLRTTATPEGADVVSGTQDGTGDGRTFGADWSFDPQRLHPGPTHPGKGRHPRV